MDDPPIERVLHISPPTIHIYTIPPITSSTFTSASWTGPPRPTAREIFTARLRIVETSYSSNNKITVTINLEDPSSGELFAGAPYTSPAVVQQASDSSRFFTIRVQGEGGMKATLGMGFEERGDALDFNIALREAGKVLGFVKPEAGKKADLDVRKDFSLKEGEKIHISVQGKGRRNQQGSDAGAAKGNSDDSAALFSIAPPPAPAAKAQNDQDDKLTAQELGFDDGEFGEFQ